MVILRRMLRLSATSWNRATTSSCASHSPRTLVSMVRNHRVRETLAESAWRLTYYLGQRIGAVSFLTSTPEEAINVESQLKILVRPMYSNPPKQGAKIVSAILKYTFPSSFLRDAFSDSPHQPPWCTK